jgi:hypothetical protein
VGKVLKVRDSDVFAGSEGNERERACNPFFSRTGYLLNSSANR